MFFGTKLIKYQVSFGDPLNLWGFYSLTAPHYGKGSTLRQTLTHLEFQLEKKSKDIYDSEQKSLKKCPN